MKRLVSTIIIIGYNGRIPMYEGKGTSTTDKDKALKFNTETEAKIHCRAVHGHDKFMFQHHVADSLSANV